MKKQIVRTLWGLVLANIIGWTGYHIGKASTMKGGVWVGFDQEKGKDNMATGLGIDSWIDKASGEMIGFVNTDGSVMLNSNVTEVIWIKGGKGNRIKWDGKAVFIK